MDFIQERLIDPVSHFLWSYLLIWVLLGAGFWFTFRTRFVQFRMFGRMVSLLRGSREGAEGGVSSFQAFCIGLASRVGTGNIAGVAIALTLGGPGAIFWMWCVALIGMATALVEATLAQLFKVPNEDGSFRGGPAYYIERGLRSRKGGILFAVLLIFAFGIAFEMVQANTITDVMRDDRFGEGTLAIVLVVLTAPVLFGGVRRIARVAELVLPVMALTYVGLAVLILILNIGKVPGIIGDIFTAAFGIGPAAAGVAGGVAAALLNGVKRGLFSNEAGMGSAPNAAATATTAHPVNQGLIQSLGVFVDTMVICTATAIMILLAPTSVYDPGVTTSAQGASLTQAAVAAHLGDWSAYLMTILVTVFAYSSVLGNYTYAEINMTFLGAGPRVINAFRVVVLAAIGLGAVVALDAVWAIADVAMALMALVNLVAIVLLGKWAFGALADYEGALRAGRVPLFRAKDNPQLERPLDTEVW
ncbi:alanine/glycine:cation symporter family protein [Monashia sp. NPDC004114]